MQDNENRLEIRIREAGLLEEAGNTRSQGIHFLARSGDGAKRDQVP